MHRINVVILGRPGYPCCPPHRHHRLLKFSALRNGDGRSYPRHKPVYEEQPDARYQSITRSESIALTKAAAQCRTWQQLQQLFEEHRDELQPINVAAIYSRLASVAHPTARAAWDADECEEFAAFCTRLAYCVGRTMQEEQQGRGAGQREVCTVARAAARLGVPHVWLLDELEQISLSLMQAGATDLRHLAQLIYSFAQLHYQPAAPWCSAFYAASEPAMAAVEQRQTRQQATLQHQAAEGQPGSTGPRSGQLRNAGNSRSWQDAQQPPARSQRRSTPHSQQQDTSTGGDSSNRRSKDAAPAAHATQRAHCQSLANIMHAISQHTLAAAQPPESWTHTFCAASQPLLPQATAPELHQMLQGLRAQPDTQPVPVLRHRPAASPSGLTPVSFPWHQPRPPVKQLAARLASLAYSQHPTASLALQAQALELNPVESKAGGRLRLGSPDLAQQSHPTAAATVADEGGAVQQQRSPAVPQDWLDACIRALQRVAPDLMPAASQEVLEALDALHLPGWGQAHQALVQRLLSSALRRLDTLGAQIGGNSGRQSRARWPEEPTPTSSDDADTSVVESSSFLGDTAEAQAEEGGTGTTGTAFNTQQEQLLAGRTVWLPGLLFTASRHVGCLEPSQQLHLLQACGIWLQAVRGLRLAKLSAVGSAACSLAECMLSSAPPVSGQQQSQLVPSKSPDLAVAVNAIALSREGGRAAGKERPEAPLDAAGPWNQVVRLVADGLAHQLTYRHARAAGRAHVRAVQQSVARLRKLGGVNVQAHSDDD